MKTARLRLRPPADADIDAIFEYGSDASVTELMDWRRLVDRDEVKDFLARTDASWHAGTEFMWVITEITPDIVIGGISLRLREADADFGYVLNQRFWGHGYATEAAQAIVSWATSVRRIPRVWASCDTENYRSMRVLSKLGLTREGYVEGGTVRPNISEAPRPSYVYGRTINAV
jgi:[ribosomal protein S5]-alanine N-acetyltransferase